MIWLRSLLFLIAFYGWTALMCFSLLWMLLLPRPQMIAVVVWYLRTIGWMERVIVGIRYEVRGAEHIPEGSFLLAAKHQSAWETMKLHLLVRDPAVILKRELTWIPIWGWYAKKAKMIPVDRGAGGAAIKSLIRNSRPVRDQGRPIVIFPQGTRVAVGTYAPYRIGVGVLYESLKIPIVPMALNAGLYWPRHKFLKRPGTVVVEFLPPILPGLPRVEAMRDLEDRLEAASDRLVMAAGGPSTVRPPAAHPPQADAAVAERRPDRTASATAD
ncbi:lysophospholipid acyltransferase family protein [Azospirillum griseum]|uniref:1-acyl-sn-glycerol-3-phosphate acyltransferase n=1 Tax=Azospirillum griseum TaxID=2496639 RepID=A0A431VFM1_9PROT|nr:lysophospholipid acyltransferase family protein [Azospirillum griseum]RTR18359.1 1-acyl-sn-glycerol-3-phosphate acyltransferase [Azospirillum griseum]